jgi:ketol-acid reductoisomerase
MAEPALPAVTIHRVASDVGPGALAGESVAVLGYGTLGRTAALNLRDSGLKVRVGNRHDVYADRARAEGFEVVPLATAAPVMVDVLLVAPRMAGGAARTRYLAGQGFWACVGVEADRTGCARERMLGLAAALGALRGGALQMSATAEAVLDLFVEQPVGPLLGAAIMSAFEVGREAGIPAEALVLEMYMSGEMEAVFEGFRTRGFFRAAEDHGPTALFGGITGTLDLDRAALAERFRRVVDEITSGAFARSFQAEADGGYPMLAIARDLMNEASAMTEAESRLRNAVGMPEPSAEEW